MQNKIRILSRKVCVLRVRTKPEYYSFNGYKDF